MQQGFEATTVAPAWLCGDERRRDRLLPGFAADLVVLDRDPWDDLDAEVAATMVDGRWVPQPAALGLSRSAASARSARAAATGRSLLGRHLVRRPDR